MNATGDMVLDIASKVWIIDSHMFTITQEPTAPLMLHRKDHLGHFASMLFE